MEKKGAAECYWLKLFLEVTLKVTGALKGKTKKCCPCRLFRVFFARNADGLGHGTRFALKELSCHNIIVLFFNFKSVF